MENPSCEKCLTCYRTCLPASAGQEQLSHILRGDCRETFKMRFRRQEHKLINLARKHGGGRHPVFWEQSSERIPLAGESRGKLFCLFVSINKRWRRCRFYALSWVGACGRAWLWETLVLTEKYTQTRQQEMTSTHRIQTVLQDTDAVKHWCSSARICGNRRDGWTNRRCDRPRSWDPTTILDVLQFPLGALWLAVLMNNRSALWYHPRQNFDLTFSPEFHKYFYLVSRPFQSNQGWA